MWTSHASARGRPPGRAIRVQHGVFLLCCLLFFKGLYSVFCFPSFFVCLFLKGLYSSFGRVSIYLMFFLQELFVTFCLTVSFHVL